MEVQRKKAQVRVFLDGVHLKIVDDLIGTGYGGTRSEVIRTMIHDWVRDNVARRERELTYERARLKEISPYGKFLKMREGAVKGGYVKK